MKKRSLALVAIIIFAGFPLFAQVGIGTSAPDSSAILELQSADQGFLPPRLTTIQRDAITNPAEGLTIYNTDRSCLEFYTGFGWRNICTDSLSTDVVNPGTGKVWMDRNLGATQVATASNDANSYGHLYQWGRYSDGHEMRSSDTTSTMATTSTPGTGGNAWDGLFILNINSPFDWLVTQDGTLWQGVNGVNNPCPSGYRLPTGAEWSAEVSTWGDSTNAAGAFLSVLKLPVAGARQHADGVIVSVGVNGTYWSSTIAGAGSNAQSLIFNSTLAAVIPSLGRAWGLSVRCIKD
jgi:uncharacterized protein (TIGR02145 family)